MKIYIDESGNTGDIKINSMSEQPFFTLSGIGIEKAQEDEFSELVGDFRKAKRIQQPEIKSSNTYDENPLFTKEAISLVLKNNAPLFAETTLKKYFICANMVHHTFLPLPSNANKNEFEMIKFTANKIADFFYYNIQDYHISAYLETCKHPTSANVLALLRLLEGELLHKSENLRGALEEIFGALNRLANENPDDGDLLLPFPDQLKSGRNHWMIPYPSSFSNLYGRVNKYARENNLANMEMIHDEQKEYSEIIKKYKAALDKNILGNKYQEYATEIDFKFDIPYSLEFVDSKSATSMQFADVVAGFINKTSQRKINGIGNKDYIEILNRLQYYGEPPIGINYILPTPEFEKVS